MNGNLCKLVIGNEKKRETETDYNFRISTQFSWISEIL